MHKPDAFEWMVERMATNCEAGLWKKDVIQLLRHQHARVVQLVRTFDDGVFLDNEWIQKDRLLAAMTKMKKGTL